MSSLLAMPPPAPRTPSLAGLTTVDLPGSSLTQWAMHVQDVTSGMRMPPEVAVNCPQEDIVGVLNQLERMTLVKYCHLCFGVSKKCGCSSVPCQTPSQASALWMPPMMSYVAMASSTGMTTSSSVGGVPLLRCPTPGLPPLELVVPMDTLLDPTSENLLATVGVGRGGRGLRQLRTPTAPGLHQTRPMAPPQWMPTPGRKEASQATPYWRQVYLPQHPTGVWMTTTKPSTTPSTSQGHDEMARGSEDARGRSSSPGPQGRDRRDRSSTKGSRKCRQGIHSNDPMDNVSNYVASGWKQDLTHIISITGWIGLGGYYHWKLSQLGQLHVCPCLQGHWVPNGPIA